MIERDKFDGDIFEVACDECSEDIEIDAKGDFRKLIDTIKELGWKITKRKGEWIHICPSCAKTKE